MDAERQVSSLCYELQHIPILHLALLLGFSYFGVRRVLSTLVEPQTLNRHRSCAPVLAGGGQSPVAVGRRDSSQRMIQHTHPVAT